MKVLTTKGEIELSDLEVSDHVELGDNYRKIATEYRHGGELVRREVVVNVLRPLMADLEHGRIG